MKYQLLQKQFGINKIENLCNFEIDFPVQDMCLCEDNKLLFLSGNAIGVITCKKEIVFPWIVGLNSSSSIYCDGKNTCFVAESNGAEIKKIDILNKEIESVLTSLAHKEKIKLYFSKADKNEDGETAITLANERTLYWVSAQLNRCFKYEGTTFESVVGNGKAGYSTSNDAKSCMLNNPTGLAFHDEDLYICDDNHCIRLANEQGIKLVAGHPNKIGHQDGKQSLLTSPTKIKASKWLAYFIDDGKVKSFSYSEYVVATISNLENIVAISTDNNQNIYALRKD